MSITLEEARDEIDTAKTTIEHYSDWEAPLYNTRDGTEVATAYIHIDLRDGEIDLWTNFQGDGMPVSVRLGVIRRVEVPAANRRDTLDGLLDRLAEVLPTIIDGATVEQDQNGNWCGRLNEEAQKILKEFDAECCVDFEGQANFMDVDDLVASLDVPADAPIKARVADCEAELQRTEIVVEGNIANALRCRQAEAIDEPNDAA